MGENRRKVEKTHEHKGANWSFEAWSDGKWEIAFFMEDGKVCHPLLYVKKKGMKTAKPCKGCIGEEGKEAFKRWFASDEFLKAVGEKR